LCAPLDTARARSAHTKRKASDYDFAGGITDTDAAGLLATVQQFATDAEAWVKALHPQLA